ncbi:MAG: transposase [Actinomycetota bacterium]|nr:transposase [Actinomycetota bacterium]
MAQPQHTTPSLAHLEEALTVLFCLIDDAYTLLNPYGARHYEAIKRLSDSEVIALALFQQLRGVESERSFLRDAQRFFSHLFPGVVGLHPSSFNRRVKKLRGYLEPLRREILPELVGEPETLLVDSTLLEILHPRQVSQGAGFWGATWVRWGSFSVYGVKLHLLCATNQVPLSYELTSANIADISLTEELLAEAALGEAVARRLLGDLAYSSEGLRETLAEVGILLATERAERRRGVRQSIEIAISSLKRVFGLGETLATTLVGLATRIAAKICAYTYALLINRVLGRSQGHIKELWA